ncbi:MAG: hypothetical protein PHS49_00320 [Candidatus Gracilibacteria bacterium]|nr:hypothetical protein [Candidatus Gracilibacteria bacterium]
MKSNLLYRPSDVFSVARDEVEVDNLLNNDIYKFLMLDFILAQDEYKDVNVRWKMKIRNDNIRIADVIPLEALKEQFDATAQIKGVSQADISFLRGMQRPDGKQLFREETLKFLQEFRLPEYSITKDNEGGYDLEFVGPWKASLMWEVLGLKIVNTLYLYHYGKKEKISNVEFDEIINQTIRRLYDDVKIYKNHPGITLSEFGTRRSASTDIQRMVNEILNEKLPGQYMGTSNVMIAREMGNANPKGTNAHELRMIPTALEDDPQRIIDVMYDVDRKWGKHFPGLSILLPDTYGTSFYFKNCPEDIAMTHNGNRFDSKDPNIGIPEYERFLQKFGLDPKTHLRIPSDGLNSKIVVDIYERNKHYGPITFGKGTHLTNNTKGTWPREVEPHGPFGSMSVVVKPYEVQRPDGSWVKCVKLSDNPDKGMGEERLPLFKRTFGTEGFQRQDVLV